MASHGKVRTIKRPKDLSPRRKANIRRTATHRVVQLYKSKKVI